jgi:hypothetical protein
LSGPRSENKKRARSIAVGLIRLEADAELDQVLARNVEAVLVGLDRTPKQQDVVLEDLAGVARVVAG